MSGETGVTVVTNSRVFYLCMRGCGRIERPAFPAPSDFRRREVKKKTRVHAARSRSRGYCCFKIESGKPHSRLSSSAKADDPAFQRHQRQTEAPRRTGYSVFAEYDD